MCFGTDGTHRPGPLEGGGHLPGHLAPRVCPAPQGRSGRVVSMAIRERFRNGEGVACRFFRMDNTYLFLGNHKYWLMSHWDALDP